MNYYIETWQNGIQLLGSDYTKIVRNCRSKKKLNNAIDSHKTYLKTLASLKPNLIDLTIKTTPFK